MAGCVTEVIGDLLSDIEGSVRADHYGFVITVDLLGRLGARCWC